MNKKLKLVLLELNIPQYELAQQLGISETRLSRIVRGRLLPTEAECERIAAQVAHPVRDLFATSSGRLKGR